MKKSESNGILVILSQIYFKLGTLPYILFAPMSFSVLLLLLYQREPRHGSTTNANNGILMHERIKDLDASHLNR